MTTAETYTIADVAVKLGVSYGTLKNWLADGSIPLRSVKLGRRRVVFVDDYESFKSSIRAENSTTRPVPL